MYFVLFSSAISSILGGNQGTMSFFTEMLSEITTQRHDLRLCTNGQDNTVLWITIHFSLNYTLPLSTRFMKGLAQEIRKVMGKWSSMLMGTTWSSKWGSYWDELQTESAIRMQPVKESRTDIGGDQLEIAYSIIDIAIAVKLSTHNTISSNKSHENNSISDNPYYAFNVCRSFICS